MTRIPPPIVPTCSRSCTVGMDFLSTSVKFRVIETESIKLCLKGAKTCAPTLFCDRDLEINPMTLKLERDLDILKMYLHTENEAAILRHLQLKA